MGERYDAVVAIWEHSRIVLDHLRDCDGDTTYLISRHGRRTTPEERDEAAVSPLPPELEQLRQDWLAAEREGDAESAALLREQFDEETAAKGWFSPVVFFDASRAVEISRGVWVQDERPR